MRPDERFRASDYGPAVADILALRGDGLEPMPLTMPLTMEGCSAEMRDRLARLDVPRLVRCGLYVYFSCFEAAHTIAQDIATPEGSYWHAVVHRREPDAGNAAYWFHKMGEHPIFPALARAAGQDGPWDPFVFIDMCEKARRKAGSELETRARGIQLAEWQLLFDYCAHRTV